MFSIPKQIKYNKKINKIFLLFSHPHTKDIMTTPTAPTAFLGIMLNNETILNFLIVEIVYKRLKYNYKNFKNLIVYSGGSVKIKLSQEFEYSDFSQEKTFATFDDIFKEEPTCCFCSEIKIKFNNCPFSGILLCSSQNDNGTQLTPYAVECLQKLINVLNLKNIHTNLDLKLYLI